MTVIHVFKKWEYKMDANGNPVSEVEVKNQPFFYETDACGMFHDGLFFSQ
jgi:hypothetical protein